MSPGSWWALFFKETNETNVWCLFLLLSLMLVMVAVGPFFSDLPIAANLHKTSKTRLRGFKQKSEKQILDSWASNFSSTSLKGETDRFGVWRAGR